MSIEPQAPDLTLPIRTRAFDFARVGTGDALRISGGKRVVGYFDLTTCDEQVFDETPETEDGRPLKNIREVLLFADGSGLALGADAVFWAMTPAPDVDDDTVDLVYRVCEQIGKSGSELLSFAEFMLGRGVNAAQITGAPPLRRAIRRELAKEHSIARAQVTPDQRETLLAFLRFGRNLFIVSQVGPSRRLVDPNFTDDELRAAVTHYLKETAAYAAQPDRPAERRRSIRRRLGPDRRHIPARPLFTGERRGAGGGGYFDRRAGDRRRPCLDP